MALRTPSSQDNRQDKPAADAATKTSQSATDKSSAESSEATAPQAGQAPTGADQQAQPGQQAPAASAPAAQPGQAGPDFENAVRALHQKWLEAQAALLDDPRDAAARTDEMVREGIQHLLKALDAQRGAIQATWSNDNNITTDELRDLIRRYRDLFRHALVTSYGPRANEAATKQQ
jgi:hypothetical protein